MSDSLKVSLVARVKMVKNTSKVVFDQHFAPEEADFTKYGGQIITVLTNTSSILPQAGIAAGRHLIVQVDNPAGLKINGSTVAVPLTTDGCLFLANSSLTEVKVVNSSTTLDVGVNYGVCD